MANYSENKENETKRKIEAFKVQVWQEIKSERIAANLAKVNTP
jgi:hypothetical protein